MAAGSAGRRAKNCARREGRRAAAVPGSSGRPLAAAARGCGSPAASRPHAPPRSAACTEDKPLSTLLVRSREIAGAALPVLAEPNSSLGLSNAFPYLEGPEANKDWKPQK